MSLDPSTGQGRTGDEPDPERATEQGPLTEPATEDPPEVDPSQAQAILQPMIEPDPDRVTLREAAQVTGASVAALRKWARKGLLDAKLEPGPTGPQTMVSLQAAQELATERLSRARAEPATEPPTAHTEPSTDSPVAGTSLIPLKELSGLFDRLADAERRAITAELERDHLRERLAELRAQQEEPPPPPKRSFWQRFF